MSRKAREDQSSWNMPLMYAFVGEHGPFKTRGLEPIQNTLIWLCNSKREQTQQPRAEADAQKPKRKQKQTEKHPMFSLAGHLQQELVANRNDPSESTKRYSSVLVVDLKDIFGSEEDYETALAKELEEMELTKGFGKKLLRLFQKLLLVDVIVAARGELCGVLLKVYRAIHKMDGAPSHGDNTSKKKKTGGKKKGKQPPPPAQPAIHTISQIWLLDPELSTKYIKDAWPRLLHDSDSPRE